MRGAVRSKHEQCQRLPDETLEWNTGLQRTQWGKQVRSNLRCSLATSLGSAD